MSGNANKKKNDRLPMAAIYDGMTAARFQKLRKLFWQATDSSHHRRHPELETLRQQADDAVAAQYDKDDFSMESYEAAWKPYNEMFEALQSEAFEKLCARAATKARWNATRSYEYSVDTHVGAC